MKQATTKTKTKIGTKVAVAIAIISVGGIMAAGVASMRPTSNLKSVIVAYSCYGNVPANASMCSGDDIGLTASVARSLVPTCTTSKKCEYICKDGYILSTTGNCVAKATTENEAYFKFTDGQDTFVIKLTDSGKIQQARDILSGKEKISTHVMGIVVKEQAQYNNPWHFILNPSSITFFQNATEVCDLSIKNLEVNFGENCAGLPNCRWCPWKSKLVKEL